MSLGLVALLVIATRFYAVGSDLKPLAAMVSSNGERDRLALATSASGGQSGVSVKREACGGKAIGQANDAWAAKELCHSLGCVWKEAMPGTPWCFKLVKREVPTYDDFDVLPERLWKSQSANLNHKDANIAQKAIATSASGGQSGVLAKREACGGKAIGQAADAWAAKELCNSLGCFWAPAIPGTPWCYKYLDEMQGPMRVAQTAHIDKFDERDQPDKPEVPTYDDLDVLPERLWKSPSSLRRRV